MTFLDENGNKVEFEAVARIFLGEQQYLLLAPVEEKDSEDIYVFRIDEVDGKQELNLVEDDKEINKFWNSLSFSMQKKYITWITSAKKEETRNKRLEGAIIKLKNKEKL